MISGLLFTSDYLAEGVRGSPAFRAALAAAPALRQALLALLDAAGDPAASNEAQIEQHLVRPVLDRLGWAGLMDVQVAATRSDRPDYLLFPDADAFATARALPDADKFRHAVAVADAKRWSLGLDDRGGGAGVNETPAAQMLRYMDRAAARSATCRWGLLTNGRRWRLYHQGEADRLTRYFEVDLQAALGRGAAQGELALAGPQVDADHALALFALFFGAESFGAPQRLALSEGRLWETKVRDDLARTVFTVAYPGFVQALIAGDPRRPPALDPAYLAEVREAALTLLYRLLFALYAEDRDLLPRHDRAYDDYSLTLLRDRLFDRVDAFDSFSAEQARMWEHLRGLFVIIDRGDGSLGMPPYNGKLFAPNRSALLARASIPDRTLAPLLDALSRRDEGGRKLRINYRDLSVRELGSIYERLLEYEPALDPDSPSGVALRLNPFARKGSGSYYTPDVLVRLIIERTLSPLVAERWAAFHLAATEPGVAADNRLARMNAADPASAILALRVCDPAMGSGHFLVDLVDWLSEQALTAIGRAEELAAAQAMPDWRSPAAARLAALREQVEAEAARHRWTMPRGQLTDAALTKRLVLKRCVYGVDKNPMAVELAKVALWLHTFTAGAPLSFLDHHLRCGDSLFGEWVHPVLLQVGKEGSALFLSEPVRRAARAEDAMRVIEALSDGVLAEAEQSASSYAEVQAETAPLKGFLDLWQALRWLRPTTEERRALRAVFDGQFGDPVRVAAGLEPPRPPASITPPDDPSPASAHPGEGRGPSHAARAAPSPQGSPGPEFTPLPGSRERGMDPGLRRGERIRWDGEEDEPDQPDLLGAASRRDWRTAARLLARAHALAREQRFLHWQVAFPGVWSGWTQSRTGGFDAVIGNPPWDRMDFEEVEWFAARRPTIARMTRAADRMEAVKQLLSSEDPLSVEFRSAQLLSRTASNLVKSSGDFAPLNTGKLNIYKLFVARSQTLITRQGVAGLLTPSGIATDFSSAAFFRELSTSGRVLSLLDFENRRGRNVTGQNREHFFPDVDSRFKFCIFIAGGTARSVDATECGFFLQDAPTTADPKIFLLTAADFSRLNPNTATAPIFRSARDAKISSAVYRKIPVLTNRSSGTAHSVYSLTYSQMLNMTSDSALFWTREKLIEAGAYETPGGRWAKGSREWSPLQVGRMIWHFNHRASAVSVDNENVFKPTLSERSDFESLENPAFHPEPQYWVDDDTWNWIGDLPYAMSYRDITNSTNERTMVCAIGPAGPVGNNRPVVFQSDPTNVARLNANWSSYAFDYFSRQKAQTTHLNWYVVEQLPVVPPEAYDRRFGARTAGEIVRDHVLRLSYTAHDLAPFARDLGYVDAEGQVLPPIRWDEDERRLLRARLDALYFILYGLTDRDDVRHVLSTFPIVRRKDEAAHDGVYLTEQLVLWYLAALQAGDDARDPDVPQLIASAKRQAARAA